jgi:hypothetical protein
MKDREQNQSEGLKMPPNWCSGICRNAMNEICIEHCAIKRDCSGFAIKPGVNLIDLPRFPIEHISEMTKEEKFTSVAVYVAKTVDHLKGVEDEPTCPPLRRPNHDSSTSSSLPENFESEDLLLGIYQRNTSPENRTKRQDSPDGSSKVDGKTGQAT